MYRHENKAIMVHIPSSDMEYGRMVDFSRIMETDKGV